MLLRIRPTLRLRTHLWGILGVHEWLSYKYLRPTPPCEASCCLKVMCIFFANLGLAFLMREGAFEALSLFPQHLLYFWPSFLFLFLPPLIARHLLSGLGAGQELAEKLQCCRKREEGKDRTHRAWTKKKVYSHLKGHICNRVWCIIRLQVGPFART